MTIDLKAIRAAAEAATKGSWRVTAQGKHVVSVGSGRICSSPEHMAQWNWNANAKHIATANPAAILELLDRLEAAEKALAEPAVEPFGYFRAEPFGWTDCAPTDEGAKALYEAPPPAEPARTSQDVCTVPLLSDEEVAQCIKDASKGSAINRDGSTSQRIVRSAEQLVRRKAGL